MDTAGPYKHPRWFKELDAAKLIEFLYLTGAHPAVIANPETYRLRSELRGAYLHVLWERPKKKGMAATMDLPVVRAESPVVKWLPEFIESAKVRPYTTAYLNRLLREVGKKAGVPLSARRMRHTCGVRVARKSRDIATVCAWLNCSKSTAADYLRVASSSDPRMLEVAE
jgi:integrase